MSLRSVAPLAALASALLTNAAFAQQKDGEFTVQRFLPAPGPRNFITVEGARTDGKMAFSLGLFGSYANDPFLIKTCISNTDCSANNAERLREIHIVETLVTADLLASLTVVPRLQLGLRVPTPSCTAPGSPPTPTIPQSASNLAPGSKVRASAIRCSKPKCGPTASQPIRTSSVSRFSAPLPSPTMSRAPKIATSVISRQRSGGEPSTTGRRAGSALAST